MASRKLTDLIAAVQAAGAGRLDARLMGSDIQIESVAPLETAGAGQLSFLANPRYRSAAAASAAHAIVLTPADHEALAGTNETSRTWVVCAEPYAWFAYASQQLASPAARQPGRSAQAAVALAAQVAADATVDAFAVIEDGAVIEPRAWIGAGAFVGTGARIGADTRLHPGCRVLAGCSIGARGIVHAGAVIGADGFGFAPLDGRYVKIPQTGNVVIGDDVEIGANTTIDRGTMGDTVIEDGVKIDNQVQIGHNCRIGANTVVAGCVGIAGSATIGRSCQLGGAAMILGHLSIADGCVISSGTLVSRSIAARGFYTGFFPLMTNREWERNAAVVRQLDELRRRVRALERGADDDASDPSPG